MRLDTNYRKRIVKKHKQWRLNNVCLNNQQITEEIKREIKEFLETNDNENIKPMGCSKSSSKRKFYSNTILPQETRKTSNRQPNFTPKIAGKRRTKKKKLQNQQKERNQKDQTREK